MTWKYAWFAPESVGKDYCSFFVHDSFEAAVDNAIRHARNKRKKKHLYQLPPDKKQRAILWRNMRKSGWRVRRKLEKNVDI